MTAIVGTLNPNAEIVTIGHTITIARGQHEVVLPIRALGDSVLNPVFAPVRTSKAAYSVLLRDDFSDVGSVTAIGVDSVVQDGIRWHYVYLVIDIATSYDVSDSASDEFRARMDDQRTAHLARHHAAVAAAKAGV